MTDTTRIIDEIRAALEVWEEPQLTCPHIDAMVENAALPPEAIAELDAIREIHSQLRYGTWVLRARAEAAEAKITAQAEEIERLNELTSCSVTVGRGLSVYGTIEAVGRVQTYILLDSNHPVEKADVRRTLARELQAAEARVRELEGALKYCLRHLRENFGNDSSTWVEASRAILTGEQQ